jgi:CDP-glycerol glycerophosphotransferase (TagB/SpsB family)
MAIINRLFIFLKTLFAWTLYLFSFLVPRSKMVWVFIDYRHKGDKEVFFGNSKYLFFHVSNNRARYGNPKVIWIAPDKDFASKLSALGYLAYTSSSLQGIFYSLRAKYTFADFHLRLPNWMLCGGTKIIHLWHGIPIKKIGFQRTKHPLSSNALGKFLYPDTYRQRTAKLLVTSESQIPTFTEALRISRENIFIAGYPRNIVFSGKTLPNGSLIDVDTDLLKIIESKKYSKHILYAPTYRRKKGKEEFEDAINYEEISKWLVANNYFLSVALHPRRYSKLFEKADFKNVRFLKRSDIHPIMAKVDVLINDYSSVFLDFIFTDRPIVFYAYDFKEYSEKEQLNIDYDKDTPGEKAYSKNELIPALERAMANDVWKEKRAEIRRRYHAQGPGTADGADSILKSIL